MGATAYTFCEWCAVKLAVDVGRTFRYSKSALYSEQKHSSDAGVKELHIMIGHHTGLRPAECPYHRLHEDLCVFQSYSLLIRLLGQTW